jgi:HEAT repeat protein
MFSHPPDLLERRLGQLGEVGVDPASSQLLEDRLGRLHRQPPQGLDGVFLDGIGRLLDAGQEDAVELGIAGSGPTDYRVRKAAALALPHFAAGEAEERLRRLVAEDPSSDVVGTALVALARANPEVGAAIFEEQLARDAWWDEIKIASLLAIKELERPELAAIARRFAGEGYNQDVRRAALEAWEASAPGDPELHRVLLAGVEEPPYPVQKYAIEALGRLAVQAAEPVLEELAGSGVDANFTELAKAALEEIRRVGEHH